MPETDERSTSGRSIERHKGSSSGRKRYVERHKNSSSGHRNLPFKEDRSSSGRYSSSGRNQVIADESSASSTLPFWKSSLQAIYQWISGKPHLNRFPEAQALEDFKVTLQKTTEQFNSPLAFIKGEIIEDIEESLQNPQFITKETLQIFKERMFNAEKDFAELSVKTFEVNLTSGNISFEGGALSQSLGSSFKAIGSLQHFYLP